MRYFKLINSNGVESCLIRLGECRFTIRIIAAPDILTILVAYENNTNVVWYFFIGQKHS